MHYDDYTYLLMGVGLIWCLWQRRFKDFLPSLFLIS